MKIPSTPCTRVMILDHVPGMITIVRECGRHDEFVSGDGRSGIAPEIQSQAEPWVRRMPSRDAEFLPEQKTHASKPLAERGVWTRENVGDQSDPCATCTSIAGITTARPMNLRAATRKRCRLSAEIIYSSSRMDQRCRRKTRSTPPLPSDAGVAVDKRFRSHHRAMGSGEKFLSRSPLVYIPLS
jgi:hypothetical protein